MTVQSKNLYGLILAGGYSQRMGQDKALLTYRDKSQLLHTHELLSHYCDKVFISVRDDQQQQSPYHRFPQIKDNIALGIKGPLAGIVSALILHPAHSWLVLACDLPFVDNQTIETLINGRNQQAIATAFISSYENLPEPLCAIWEAQALESIQEFVKSGISCPRKILIKSKTHLLPQENPKWLDNVNTMEEFHQAQQKLKIKKS